MVKMGLSGCEKDISISIPHKTGYEIFDDPEDQDRRMDYKVLEAGIRKIDDNIDSIDPKVLAIVNVHRSRAMVALLKQGRSYNPEWTVVKRQDIKNPNRYPGSVPVFTFTEKESASIHIPGLEIQTLRKKKIDTRYFYDVRIKKHGGESEVTLNHKKYNLLKKFIQALGDTVKIINKDRYTLRDLITSIGTGIIGRIGDTNSFGIPTELPKQEIIPLDNSGIIRDENGQEIPEYIRRFNKNIKNPEWIKRKRELEEE